MHPEFLHVVTSKKIVDQSAARAAVSEVISAE